MYTLLAQNQPVSSVRNQRNPGGNTENVIEKSISKNQSSLTSSSLPAGFSEFFGIIWVITLIGYLIITAILQYHWSRFTPDKRDIFNTQLAYYTTTSILLLTTFFIFQ
jgi:hypothetical protein